MRTLDDLRKSLRHHVPGDAQSDIATLRTEFIGLAETIEDLCPDGREKAVAYTHLEEALMWSVKGIGLELADLSRLATFCRGRGNQEPRADSPGALPARSE